MKDFFNTQKFVIIVERLKYIAYVIILLGAILSINGYSTWTVSIGIALLILHYIPLIINVPLRTVYDWTLQFPSLGGVKSDK